FFHCLSCAFLLQHFWRKGDDLHVTLVAEFPGNWPEDAGAARFVRLVQKNHCVVVEADVRTILTTKLVGGANDYRLCHGTFLDASCGKCILYGNNNLIADPGITLAAVAEYTDAKHLFGATVVRYI